jgi:hypothetical protein
MLQSVGHQLVYDKTDASRLLGVGYNTVGVYLDGDGPDPAECFAELR